MRAASYPYYLVLLLLFVSLSTSVLGQAKSTRIDSLKQKLSTTKSDSGKVDILILLSKELDCNQTQEKLKYLNESISISEKSGYENGLIESNMKMGEYHWSCTQNYRLAIQYLKNCLASSQIKSNINRHFQVYNIMASCYKKMAEYGSALACYKNILVLNLQQDRVIMTLGNSGAVYQEIGDYTNALNNYQQAYNLLYEGIVSADSTTLEDTLTLMGIKYQIAIVYLSLPDYDRAFDNFTEVQELNKTIQHPWFLVLSNMGIGDCYLHKHTFDKAIAYYKFSESTLNRPDITYHKTADQALVYFKLGETYLRTNKLDSAYYYTNKSLEIANGTGDKPTVPSQLPRIYTTLGKIYTARKKYEAAIDYLKKAVAISRATGAMDIESSALLTLSKTYEKTGRVADALHTYQNHIALQDSMHSRKKIQELTRIDMQGNFDRQQFADSMKTAEEKKIAGLQLQRQRILTYSGFGAIVLLLLLSFFIFRSYKHQKKANIVISNARDSISKEKQISEKLLLNILPEEVAEELKENGAVAAQQFDHVTVMFTDFVDFTLVSEKLTPKELVTELDTCFKAFDEIIDKYDIEKIKTVGDAYLAVSGLPLPNANHAIDVIQAATEICAFITERKKKLGEHTFDVRVGINSGSVVAGIVGMKKFAYDIWSDTVNIAARMEQSGEAGKINISEDTYQLVKDHFVCTYRGEIAAKNKGNLKMYFVEQQV